MSEPVSDVVAEKTLAAPSLVADVLPAIGENVERDDLRNALWRLSGWRLETRAVEAWLDLAERFADARAAGAVDRALAEYRGVPLREPADAVAVEAQPRAVDLVEPVRVTVAEPLRVVETQALTVAAEASVEGPPAGPGLMDRHLTCTKCEALKPADEFGADRTRPSGRKPQCKACVNEYQRQRKARMRAEREEWARQQLARLAAEGTPGPEGTPAG